jgi:hypothetical protein
MVAYAADAIQYARLLDAFREFPNDGSIIFIGVSGDLDIDHVKDILTRIREFVKSSPL